MAFFQNEAFQSFQNTVIYQSSKIFQVLSAWFPVSQRKPMSDCPAENLDALTLLGCRMKPSFCIPTKTCPQIHPNSNLSSFTGLCSQFIHCSQEQSNSRWSGGQGLSTETVNSYRQACTKWTVLLTHLAFNLQTEKKKKKRLCFVGEQGSSWSIVLLLPTNNYFSDVIAYRT